MTDLKVFGTTYTNVTGIKATDTSDAIVTFETDGSGFTVDEIGNNLKPSGNITFTGTSLTAYAFAGKPITSIVCPNCTGVADTALSGTQISSIADSNFPEWSGNFKLSSMPSLTSIKHTKLTLGSGSSALRNLTGLQTAEFPNNTVTNGTFCFGGCTSLTAVDLGKPASITNNCFNGATALRTLVLRKSDSITTLATWNAAVMGGIYNNPTASTIYVPSDLISTYQSATNWSTAYSAGVTFTAIEGSIYDD